MKILLVHNYYQHAGGEDQVLAAEADVLQAHGNTVRLYTLHNSAIGSMNKVRLAASTVWNSQVLRELTDLLRGDPPDLVHFHNTFPLVSPAAYTAARRLGIPVVQTLHNFRLLCLNSLFLREGRLCEDCLGKKVAWPGVVHACYRNSRGASAVTASMLAVHRWRGTWANAIDTYIAVSSFARAKFVAGGLPSDRIVVKPNFLSDDPGSGMHAGRYALFVGRLSPEKGIADLVRTWSSLASGVPLRIIGSGPLEHLQSDALPDVEWLGWQPRERVLAAMKEAMFLVFPTECYEGFPMVLLEAMATGLPVLATNRGSLPEIVRHGTTGLLVECLSGEWSKALRWALDHPAKLIEMGRRSREEFTNKYTAGCGYRLLMNAYAGTMTRSGHHVPAAVRS